MTTEPLQPPAPLRSAVEWQRVRFDGQAIGALQVTERTDRRILGHFVPCADYELARPAFEEAVRRSWQAWESVGPGLDQGGRGAWEAWSEAIVALTPRVSLDGVPVALEAFAVDHAGDVQVTLAGPPAG